MVPSESKDAFKGWFLGEFSFSVFLDSNSNMIPPRQGTMFGYMGQVWTILRG